AGKPWRPSIDRRRDAGTELLRRRAAAGGDALERRADDGHALTLAGVLALARGACALAGALALAGIDAVALVGGLGVRCRGDCAAALDAFGVRGGDEAAGREDRCSRGDDRALGHDLLPVECASETGAAGRPCNRSTPRTCAAMSGSVSN